MRHPWTTPDQARRLDPYHLFWWLRRQGWDYVRSVPSGPAEVYRNGDLDVTVPMDRDVGDYHTRITEIITALAVNEDRCECAVWADLLALGESDGDD